MKLVTWALGADIPGALSERTPLTVGKVAATWSSPSIFLAVVERALVLYSVVNAWNCHSAQ